MTLRLALVSVLTCMIGCAGCAAGTSLSASRRSGLSFEEVVLATRIAHAQARIAHARVLLATVTVDPGTISDPNTGRACTSGRLLSITLVGRFDDISVASPPNAPSLAVTAELITADAVSGQVCLISVTTGAPPDDATATVLFR